MDFITLFELMDELANEIQTKELGRDYGEAHRYSEAAADLYQVLHNAKDNAPT
jgi:hypothetical protein